MKKYSNLFLTFCLFVFILTGTKVQAQFAACSGTVTANYTTLANYASSTTIGNGTTGSIQVCITNNNLTSTMCSGAVDQIIIMSSTGGILAQWSSATANGTCYTYTTTTGYGYIAFYNPCSNTTHSATVTWSTVSGGVSVCPTCTDGIQNGTETGIDCGGSCAACSGTCFNGIQDGTETGIDCGGSCAAVCGTCFDGIQNGTETGVDCGGSCALVCTTNSGTVTSTCGACPAASSAVVYTTTCAQVGTSAYGMNSPSIYANSCGTSTTPSPAPSCGTVGSEGTWVHVDLGPGVTQVQLAFEGGTVASGNSNTYAQAYQGTGCGALSPVTGGCQNSVAFSGGIYSAPQVFFTGLNPSQDLWIFFYNDGGKTFDLQYNLIGTTSAPSNTTCASAQAAAGEACNLGASGGTFTTPGAGGQACTGGNWGSNENTTYYTFTPTSSTATLNVTGITCNDGTSGSAQFGVWTSCPAVGTYTSTSTWLGCVVGSSNLTMSGLTAGQTYYIVTDGFAGDNCTWTFSGTNIVLPIDLLDFTARANGTTVNLSWITISETNNAYFTIEKSKNGEDWEMVSIVKGATFSQERLKYSSED